MWSAFYLFSYFFLYVIVYWLICYFTELPVLTYGSVSELVSGEYLQYPRLRHNPQPGDEFSPPYTAKAEFILPLRRPTRIQEIRNQLQQNNNLDYHKNLGLS